MLTERSILEYDRLERKLLSNARLKELISNLNRLQTEFDMNQGKISELENTHSLNKKYLFEEEWLRNVYLKDHITLTTTLDNLSTRNEEKIKEREEEQRAEANN